MQMPFYVSISELFQNQRLQATVSFATLLPSFTHE
jgi:hypothetical protein